MAPRSENIDKQDAIVSRAPGAEVDIISRPMETSIAIPAALPRDMLLELQRQGIDPDAIREAYAPLHWKIGWEELCNLRTRDEKTMASPICVITSLTEFPDAPTEFDSYVGFVRIEFTTEHAERWAVTHSRCYAETGEFLPLTEWVKGQLLPVACRFGYVATRKEKRHVVRPLPCGIEVQ